MENIKADFMRNQDNVITFDLDFSQKTNGNEPLESGGQVFRSVLAFVGRLALTRPQEQFKIVIQNIRKGRKPKVGMRPQHITCVHVVKTVLERFKRSIAFCDDFCEDSETLTIIFEKSPDFTTVITNPTFDFNIDKTNVKTGKPSEEAATLVLQTWLMLTWGLFEKWSIVIDGGLDMRFSPGTDFIKNVLGPCLGFRVESVKGIGRTGTLRVECDQPQPTNICTFPISSKYLFDQLLFFIGTIKCPVEYSCDITSHALSQMYLWEALLGVKFIMENGRVCVGI